MSNVRSSHWADNQGRQPVRDDTMVVVQLIGLSDPCRPMPAKHLRWSFSKGAYGDVERWRRA